MSVLRGGNTFDGKEIIEGEITAGFTRAIGNNDVVENVDFFYCGGEIGVDKGVKVRVQGLEDRDGTFISGPRFVNECTAGDFEGFGEETSGEDERDEALELLEPGRTEVGEEVESETTKSGFGGNMFYGVMERWEGSSKIGFRG